MSRFDFTLTEEAKEDGKKAILEMLGAPRNADEVCPMPHRILIADLIIAGVVRVVTEMKKVIDEGEQVIVAAGAKDVVVDSFVATFLQEANGAAHQAQHEFHHQVLARMNQGMPGGLMAMLADIFGPDMKVHVIDEETLAAMRDSQDFTKQ